MIYGESLQISTERNDNDILYIRTAGRSLLRYAPQDFVRTFGSRPLTRTEKIKST